MIVGDISAPPIDYISEKNVDGHPITNLALFALLSLLEAHSQISIKDKKITVQKPSDNSVNFLGYKVEYIGGTRKILGDRREDLAALPFLIDSCKKWYGPEEKDVIMSFFRHCSLGIEKGLMEHYRTKEDGAMAISALANWSKGLKQEGALNEEVVISKVEQVRRDVYEIEEIQDLVKFFERGYRYKEERKILKLQTVVSTIEAFIVGKKKEWEEAKLMPSLVQSSHSAS